MEEFWKDVIGYEGLYQISNLGRAKRFYKNKSEKILKPIKGHLGYMFYSFCKETKNKTYRIHRLVALHFIPNPNNYPEVNHIDGDKENYSIENLEWCTRSQNMKHGHTLGLIFIDRANAATRIITEDKTTWLPLILVALASFIITLDSTFMNVSISQLVLDLNTSLSTIQLIICFYTLITASLMLVGSKLQDIVGKKKIFLMKVKIKKLTN